METSFIPIQVLAGPPVLDTQTTIPSRAIPLVSSGSRTIFKDVPELNALLELIKIPEGDRLEVVPLRFDLPFVNETGSLLG